MWAFESHESHNAEFNINERKAPVFWAHLTLWGMSWGSTNEGGSENGTTKEDWDPNRPQIWAGDGEKAKNDDEKSKKKKIDLDSSKEPYIEIIDFLIELTSSDGPRGYVGDFFVRTNIKGGSWTYGYNRSDNPLVVNGQKVMLYIRFCDESKLTGREIGRASCRERV